MSPVTDEFLNLPELTHLARVALRLVAAALLGGLVGAEREWVGKAAGLRTHMLVSLGATLFVLAPAEAGLGEGDTSRIIQGIAAGIGFIGAGTILKREDREEIQGLTTAASIWLTSAIGVAVAVGPVWLPVMCVVITLLILYVLGAIGAKFGSARPKASRSEEA
jgi:putative Mg2+ transporter-C (MgtC) family protein